jgi:hypothetical protein
VKQWVALKYRKQRVRRPINKEYQGVSSTDENKYKNYSKLGLTAIELSGLYLVY